MTKAQAIELMESGADVVTNDGDIGCISLVQGNRAYVSEYSDGQCPVGWFSLEDIDEAA